MIKMSQIVLSLFLLPLGACGGAVDDGAGTSSPSDSADVATPGKTSQAVSNDYCKNVDITVRNGTKRVIRVLYVKFWSASEGERITEGLNNVDLSPGFYFTWQNQDLAHAENDLITSGAYTTATSKPTELGRTSPLNTSKHRTPSATPTTTSH